MCDIERHLPLIEPERYGFAASLEPDGLRRVVRDLKKVNAALKYKDRDILEIEELQRKTKIFLLSRK